MKTTGLVIVVLLIYIIAIDARSILQNVDELFMESISDDEESNPLSNSYRHHLQHSSAFQTLRWSPKKLDKSELCEFCDLILPLVSEELHFKFAHFIDSILDANIYRS